MGITYDIIHDHRELTRTRRKADTSIASPSRKIPSSKEFLVGDQSIASFTDLEPLQQASLGQRPMFSNSTVSLSSLKLNEAVLEDELSGTSGGHDQLTGGQDESNFDLAYASYAKKMYHTSHQRGMSDPGVRYRDKNHFVNPCFVEHDAQPRRRVAPQRATAVVSDGNADEIHDAQKRLPESYTKRVFGMRSPTDHSKPDRRKSMGDKPELTTSSVPDVSATETHRAKSSIDDVNQCETLGFIDNDLQDDFGITFSAPKSTTKIPDPGTTSGVASAGWLGRMRRITEKSEEPCDVTEDDTPRKAHEN